MNDNLEMSEIRERWEDQNKIRYEGTQGVENLKKLLGVIGYKDGNYMGYGNELINFLSDNSGAIEALIAFIDNAGVDEWKDNLADVTNLEEEND